MSYRNRTDGYDPLKWGMAPKKRERRATTKWMLALSLLLMIVIAVVAVIEPGEHNLPIPGILLPGLIAAGMSPFARAPWLTARGRARYDEFERAAYARATVIAYVVLFAAMLAVFLWCSAAAHNGWPMPHDSHAWSTWALALLVTGATLPLLIAEIIVPLPADNQLEWDE